ncbi:MAG: transposase [Ignavibacteria bacterium]|nr:transposase [Ignavibacteria bacterium]
MHTHWHTDISYLWEFGYRAYLVAVVDGFSRAVLHHQVMKSMTTGDVELVLQVAREKYPQARPRVITDNGSQFVSSQFKGFLADCGFTHAKTSVGYPQSNGKMERQFRTTKEGLRQRSIIDFDDLVDHVSDVITFYNTLRYHSALRYVTPQDVLEGRADMIHTARSLKLDDARERRKLVNSLIFN